MPVPPPLLVLNQWKLWSVLRGGFPAKDGAGWGFEGGEMAILVILGRFWSVRYPTDGSIAATISICHCGDVPEYLFMASDQFLANGGGLTRRTSKVTADFRFLRFYKRGISHDWRNFQ